MSNIAQIKSTIVSTKKTMKITNAMQLVSTSRLARSQQRVERTKPYAKIMRHVISHIASSRVDYQHPFLKRPKKVDACGIIVISTDRGLCGSLNSRLFKLVLTQLSELEEQGIDQSLCLFGNKAIQFFSKFSGKVVASSRTLGDHPSLADVLGIVKWMIDAFQDGRLQKVYLACNEFKGVMTQEPELIQLLPLPKKSVKTTEEIENFDYIYEPSSKEILDVLLHRYIETLVYQSVVENVACEHAARMIAMKNATENANKLLDDLNLIYNKARQASITQELAEIVAGSIDDAT